ncbi:MAG: hypothetical protein WC539_01260 [Nitrospirota bacterium]
MDIHDNEAGMSTIKLILIIGVLFVIFHVGYKLVPMYFDAERMKDEMAVKASVAQVLKDEEIRADLVKVAKELELPLGPSSFLIKRNEEQRTMSISTAWEVEVHFLFDVYVRTFQFAPSVYEDYSKGRK